MRRDKRYGRKKVTLLVLSLSQASGLSFLPKQGFRGIRYFWCIVSHYRSVLLSERQGAFRAGDLVSRDDEIGRLLAACGKASDLIKP